MVGGFSTIPGMRRPVNTNQVKDKAERLIYDNESFLIYDPSAPLESPMYNEIGVRLNERIRDATYQFMLGMIDEQGFEAEIDRWLEEGAGRLSRNIMLPTEARSDPIYMINTARD